MNLVNPEISMNRGNFKQKSIIFYIVPLMLSLWIFLAFLRTGYNFLRFFTGEREDIFLSEESKKQKHYGNLYVISEYLRKHTKTKDPVLIVGNAGQLYFFLRYSLYPQKIYWVSNLGNYKIKPTWKYILYTGDITSLEKRKGLSITIPGTNSVVAKLMKQNE
jgi:hypothetical protein